MFLLLAAAGCGGGGAGTGLRPGGPVSVLAGFAIAGPFTGGAVDALRVTSGDLGTSVGASAAFGSTGAFTVVVNAADLGFGGPVILVASGSYRDEATGSTQSTLNPEAVPAIKGLRAAVPAFTAGGSVTGVNITPFTDFAVACTFSLPVATRASAFATSYANALGIVGAAFGLTAGDIQFTVPADPTVGAAVFGSASAAAQRQGLLIAAISQLALNLGSTKIRLVYEMAADFGDNCALDSGVSLLGLVPGYNAALLRAQLSAALGQFLSSSSNQSGLNANSPLVREIQGFLASSDAALTIGDLIAPAQASACTSFEAGVRVTNAGGNPARITAVQLAFSRGVTANTTSVFPITLTSAQSVVIPFTAQVPCDATSAAAVADFSVTATETTTGREISTSRNNIGSVLILGAQPQMAVSNCAASTSTVEAGGSFSVTARVTNTGTVTVSNIVPSLTFSPPGGGFTFTASPQNIATLAPSQGQTVTYQVTAGSSPGGFAVSPSATGQFGAATASASCQAAGSVTVVPATVRGLTVLAVSASRQSAFAGQPVTFTVSVQNTGNVTATSVQVQPFDGQAFAVFTAAPANPAGIAAGATATFVFQSVVTQNAPLGPATVDASATAVEAGLTVSDGGATTPATVTIVAAPAAALTVSIQAASAVVQCLTTDVTVSVTNTGDATATGVVVTLDDQRNEFTYGSAPASQTIAPNQARTFSFSATAPCTATTGQNTLLATASGFTAGTTAPVSGSASRAIAVLAAPAQVTRGIELLRVETQESQPVQCDPTTFTVSVRNTGNVTATSVEITLSTTPTGILSTATQAPTPLTIAPGATATFILTSSIRCDAPTGPAQVDASVTAVQASQSVTDSGADDTAFINVRTRAFAFTVLSVQLPSSAPQCSSVTVTVVVTNTGTTPANQGRLMLRDQRGEIVFDPAEETTGAIPADRSKTFSFTAMIPCTATTGLTSVTADLTMTSARGDAPATATATVPLTITTGTPQPGSFTFSLRAPGAIDKTSLASGQSTTSQTNVALTVTADAGNQATATLSNFQLRIQSGATDVTSAFAIAASETSVPVAAGASRTVTFTVTALETALKFERLTLTATASIANAGSTTSGTATDAWYVRDAATGLLGQPDFASNAPSAAGTASLRLPGWVLVDDAGRVIVSDTGNNRVLLFPSTDATRPATVLGQTNLDSGASNGPGVGNSPGDNTLSAPGGLAVTGTRLLVADTGNNRVLIFEGYANLSNAGGVSPAAAVVIGQSSFTSGSVNRGAGGDPVGNGFSSPAAVAVTGNQLVVSDTGNSRILVFSGLASLTSTAAGAAATATGVFGQNCLAGPGCGDSNQGASVTTSSLAAPTGLAFFQNSLVVADTANNRVVIYDAFSAKSTSTTSSPRADAVVGQLNRSSSGTPTDPTSQSLAMPQGVWISANRLFVGDTGNNRLMVYDGFLTLDIAGSRAADLYGQETFFQDVDNNSPTAPGAAGAATSTAGTPSRFSASGPVGVFGSSDGSAVWVADRANNRVLLVALP